MCAYVAKHAPGVGNPLDIPLGELEWLADSISRRLEQQVEMMERHSG